VKFETRIVPMTVPAVSAPEVAESAKTATDGYVLTAWMYAFALAAAGTGVAATGVAATAIVNGTTCVTAAPA